MSLLLDAVELDVFCVASQQLPMFDVHDLFGYATLILVTVHLVFKLPVVMRWLRREPQESHATRAMPASSRWERQLRFLP